MRKNIIIIDDDRDLCTLLQESLLQENIYADISCNGFDVQILLERYAYSEISGTSILI